MSLCTKLSVCAVALLILTPPACHEQEKQKESHSIKAKQQEEFPDVTLSNEIATDTEIQRVKFKMKGNMARTDDEEGLISSIHDPEKGVTILDHRKKTYAIVPLELPDNSKMSPELTEMLAAAAKMQYTGRKKKIGDLDCEEFVLWDLIGSKFPIDLQTRIVGWIAKDLKGGAEIQARKEKVAPNQLVQWMKKSTSKNHIGFPGFAARVETTQALGRYSMVNTCVKISFSPLDAKEFSIPSDYTQATLPKTE